MSDAITELLYGRSQAAYGPSNLKDPQQWFVNAVAGQTGTINVNEITALNCAAVYSCVSLIAATIASLPCKVYQRRSDGGQDEVTDDPANDFFQREYNPNTSAMTGREAEVGHLLTWGNSYTQIVRNRRGENLRLQPLGPDICEPHTDRNGDLYYEVWATDGATEPDATLRRDEVIHTPGLTFDSLVAMSPVQINKSLIRTGLAQDRTAERGANTGFKSPGAIKFPAGKKFKNAAEGTQFRDRFRQIHMKDGGDQEILILEDGSEWIELGMSPAAAHQLASRVYTRGEIAGIFKVPPHMIGDTEKTSSWGTGIEEQNIGFVTYCLLPWLRRLEQERNRKLFKRGSGLFCEHVLAGLLRGDMAKRSQALQILSRNGIITVNEWRRLEGMNPVAGGNVRFFPLNMGRIGEDGEIIPAPPAPPPAKIPAGPGSRIPAAASSVRKALAGAMSRCLRKESAEAVKASKEPSKFLAWIETFYAKHVEMVRDNCSPLVESLAHMAGIDQVPDYAASHVTRSREDLLAASECKPAELATAVERVTTRWHTDRIHETVLDLVEKLGETHAI
jgi:HK97 family phage portal protein